MNLGENLRRVGAAAGVLAVLAAGAWLLPLLPVGAQEAPGREREAGSQARQLRDTAKKLEKLREDLDRQRLALDEQRRALEAQAKQLSKAMQEFQRAKQAQTSPVPDPEARQVELKNRLDQLLLAQQKAAAQQAAKKPPFPAAGYPVKFAPANIHERLDQIEQALMKALQEVQSLRRETAQRGPVFPQAAAPPLAPPGYRPVPPPHQPGRPVLPPPPTSAP